VRSVAVPLLSLLLVGLAVGCGGDDGGGANTASFEGQPWVLVSGIPLPQDVAIKWPTATFENGMVSGSTGCNQYTGRYTTNPDADVLELGELATTRMACAPPADTIERSYLDSLGKVAKWFMDDEEFVLADAEDAELLRYKPKPAGS
jgi:heat shock protein HslJ